MTWAISLSLLPVIINCLIYLIVLYDINKGKTLQEMINHPSSIGLSLRDMEGVSYIFWGGFYLFLTVLIRQEFGISYGEGGGDSFCSDIVGDGRQVLILIFSPPTYYSSNPLNLFPIYIQAFQKDNLLELP